MIDFLTISTSDFLFASAAHEILHDMKMKHSYRDKSSKAHGFVVVIQLHGVEARMFLIRAKYLLASHRDKYSVTRIDVAHDYMVASLGDLLVEDYETRARAVFRHDSRISGATFGSRSSRRYLRVYDANLKHRLGKDTMRVEFELKDKRILDTILTSDMSSWHSAAWTYALDGRVADNLHSGVRRHLRKRYAYTGDVGTVDDDGDTKDERLNLTWLKSVVVPYIKRLVERHGETAIHMVLPILVELVEYIRSKK